MRAVLRTVAQCHSHRILHRDVKPGNFMLLHPGPRAPLKGIGAWRAGGPCLAQPEQCVVSIRPAGDQGTWACQLRVP